VFSSSAVKKDERRDHSTICDNPVSAAGRRIIDRARQGLVLIADRLGLLSLKCLLTHKPKIS
jgi:hypothetical protein